MHPKVHEGEGRGAGGKRKITRGGGDDVPIHLGRQKKTQTIVEKRSKKAGLRIRAKGRGGRKA